MYFNSLEKPTLKVSLNLKLILTLILLKLCASFLHFLMIPYTNRGYMAIRTATHNRQNAVITWKFKRKQSTSHLLCAPKQPSTIRSKHYNSAYSMRNRLFFPLFLKKK